MLIYLADLAHDYLPARQFVPLGISYIASYAKSVVGDAVEFRLFKSADRLLEASRDQCPDLVGLTNYIWNVELTKFAGRRLKADHPDLPIIAGGPNIRTDADGIAEYLKENEFIDVYCMFGGEVPATSIIQHLSALQPADRTADTVRALEIDSCYSLKNGSLAGNSKVDEEKDLDFIPSPYVGGILDPFLNDGFIPIVETNRGCPYSCSFCVWGISALNKLRKFSMERVLSELDYIVDQKTTFPQIVFADANFGILKRDVEISQHLRDLYDRTKAFSQVEMYWSKSAQDHMVDIGRILGHLTHTYIAFQSLDDGVLNAINRKNISTDKLMSLIARLRDYTYSTRTDILVGLPGETYESHLSSLDKALRFGINYILGGEIRMLPGSEMDWPSYRQQHGIKTKYRLYEGCSGIYQGELVYETEEVIRATNHITEEEMVRLRALRAMFFASITIGEHRPLISFLVKQGISVTTIFEDALTYGADDPDFKPAVDWLINQTRSEFFGSIADIEEYLSDQQHRQNLLDENAVVKLNFAFTARLYLNPSEHDAYYRLVRSSVLRRNPSLNESVLDDILALCKARTLFVKCLSGIREATSYVNLKPETIQALIACGYLPSNHSASQTGRINLYYNEVSLRELIGSRYMNGFKTSLLDMSQLMQNFQGRMHYEPERQLVSTVVDEAVAI